MKTYFRLLPFLKPYIWPYFIIGMVCMLGYSATGGVIPFLVQSVFDDLFQRKDVDMLYYLPLPPLFLQMLTGVYLFVLPYAARWRAVRRTS